MKTTEIKLADPLIFFIFFNLFSMQSQAAEVRLYTFGHSLIDHALPINPPPGNETTILHWIHDIAQTAGHDFATGGQYGFLTTHDDLPPSSNWGYNNIPSVWDDSVEPFSAANINAVLLTAANFIQYQPANLPHPLDSATTAVQATETIFDWVNSQQSDVKYYIYINWPEMDLQNAYPPTPPTQSEIDDFHSVTIQGFNDWWTDYNNFLQNSRPQYAIEFIPVGPIISKILTQIIPNDILFTDLYEDSAPHGKPTLYFLAGMITYMALYNETIPSNYMPNTIIHPGVRNNLNQIRNFIWAELGSNVIFSNGFE